MNLSVKHFAGVILLCAFIACQFKHEVVDSQVIEIEEVPVFTRQSGEGNLYKSADGNIYLSFIEYENDTLDVLKFCKWQNGKWSDPLTIASGSNWFVNWADFPAVVQFENDPSSLMAHWLQKSTNGTYDYDIRISISRNGGLTWSPSIILHQDRINAEHGFVSLVPDGESIRAIWLDGRNTKSEKNNLDHENHNHGGGPMTLYTVLINKSGQILNEVMLDNSVCDCCQTDAVLTDKGIVAVYRDRTENEIRDIGITTIMHDGRFQNKMLSHDGWEINGCPVNGPAIDAHGPAVAVAWYTEADKSPKIKLAVSYDSGTLFSKPIDLPTIHALGRLDIKFITPEKVIITYMDKLEEDTWIVGVIYDISTKSVVSKTNLIKADERRSSGFPRIVFHEKDLILVSTDISNNLSQIKTYKLLF